jgi:hypothetical protein
MEFTQHLDRWRCMAYPSYGASCCVSLMNSCACAGFGRQF